jgi:hypothetical protein
LAGVLVERDIVEGDAVVRVLLLLLRNDDELDVGEHSPEAQTPTKRIMPKRNATAKITKTGVRRQASPACSCVVGTAAGPSLSAASDCGICDVPCALIVRLAALDLRVKRKTSHRQNDCR